MCKSVYQLRTSLIYFEFEVPSINECTKLVQHLRHALVDLSHIDLFNTTKCYNNNHACLDWSKSLTKKGMKKISLRENHIRECIHLKEIEILHIAGKLNVSDVFTKQLRDGAHFQALHIAFMHLRPNI